MLFYIFKLEFSKLIQYLKVYSLFIVVKRNKRIHPKIKKFKKKCKLQIIPIVYNCI